MYPIQYLLVIATLYSLTLVVIILLRTRTYQVGRPFAWYILWTAAWMMCAALMQPRFGLPVTLWLTRATFFVCMMFCINWVWFCANFPQRSPRFRTAAWVMSAISFPWLLLPWTDLVIVSVKFQPGWVDAQVGPLVLPFTVWFWAWTAGGAAHLFYKVKRLRGLERLQVRYILLGFFGLGIIGSIPDLVLPMVTHSTRYALYGPLSALFVSTSTTYAIVRYRLLDMRIVIRAGLIYSLTIGMLSLLFALLVPLLNNALEHYLHFPQGAGSFIMAFLMALAFQPLRHQVQYLVDKRFFKSVYDYRLTLREAGSALASARDRDLLTATLVDALVRTLRPRTVAVYLPGNEEVLTQAMTTGPWEELPRTLPASQPILDYVMVTDEVLLTEELLRQQEPQLGIGRLLQQWNTFVLIPLIAGDRLCGLAVLGEKLSGDVYTADDIGLLRILGKQAAIALDNARHYDDVVLMNEYHERLLHSMQDGVIAVDPEERIITFNPAAERITGIPAPSALGRHLEEIALTQLPIRPSGEQAVETTLTMADGSEVPVLVTVTPFLRRWDVAHSRLIVFRDLSALRALEQEKVQAERFSSMGAMAASLAHEIKNPLVPIQMFAHMLPTKYDDPEFREEFSLTVVNEVERISRLVGQMLDLVRKPSHDRAAIDLRDVLGDLMSLIRPDCERNAIQVLTRFDDRLPMVVGVAGQLYQAILNVLMNAVQAMPEGGVLTVVLSGKANDITCRISDTGPGVPPESLARLFEPLFTTKVGGHGLGLALTYQFVRSHGGEVRAECSAGNGLTVILTFPAGRQIETDAILAGAGELQPTTGAICEISV